MDTAAQSSTRPTFLGRYHRRYPPVEKRGEVDQHQQEEEAEDALSGILDKPISNRDMHGRAVMRKPHRIFHRRQAHATNVLTVNVQVINTVDPNGNIVAQQTVTPAALVVPTVPAVPPVPTNPVPSVPAVPAFPSALTVPGYPFVSDAAASSSSTPGPTPALTSSSANSTTSSIAQPSSSTSSSSLSSSSTSTSSSLTSSSSSSTPSTSFTSSSSSSTATSNGFFGGGGGGNGNPATVTPPVSSSPAGTAGAQQSSGSSLGTPQVVGTVFGSLAGAALILALFLFLLKRHKRQQQSAPLQLPEDDHADNQPMTQTQPTRQVSYMAPSFLNRFSGTSRSTSETASTGEKSFQRISGRKLPSAFSEGLTSEQFARGEGTLSGSSFYKDDKGIYGGPGVIPKDFALAKETSDSSGAGARATQELVRPSPARTPVLHHPDDAPAFGAGRNGGGSTLSPPLTPTTDYPPRGTLGRSHPSHDGSRSSRFTENV